MTTAANICRQLPPDSADLLVEAVPLLQNLLTVQDSKVSVRASGHSQNSGRFTLYGTWLQVVEQVCVCLARIADAFATQPDALAKLCTQALISEVATFISVSSGGQTPLSPSTYAVRSGKAVFPSLEFLSFSEIFPCSGCCTGDGTPSCCVCQWDCLWSRNPPPHGNQWSDSGHSGRGQLLE